MKQENYVIGLDLGINNVGWSIVNLDGHKIEKCGVRLFNPSDDAKTRRGARSDRRRLKRATTRVNDSLKLFKSIGYNNTPSIDEKLLEKRVKGLTEKIEIQDIINIVKYMMSHRGYIPFDDEEVNYVDLDGLYPCEFYLKQLNENGKYRGMNLTLKSEEIKRELESILNKQINFYPELSKIKDKLLDIYSRKREFWEGPGSEKSLTPFGRFKTKQDVIDYENAKVDNPSYEKYLFEELIGKCNVVELNQPCVPKANFYAEQFNLINDFTNLTFNDVSDARNLDYFVEISNGYKLNSLGIESIIDYCMNCNSTLKLDKMFKDVLGLKLGNANGFRENKDRKYEMSTMDAYRNILRLLKNYELSIPSWMSNIELYNILMYYINVVPSSIMLVQMLKNDKEFSNYITDENEDFIKEVYKSIKSKYNEYHSLSEIALKTSIHDMLTTNMNYQQVRKKFDYDKKFKEECSKNYLSINGLAKMTDKYIDDLIASPQVKKSLRQSIKVINAIIKEKNALPYCISIESEKEVNSDEIKKQINSEQKLREDLRKKAINIIESNGYNSSEQLILKVMLYEEINGYCPYCNSQKIDLKDVLDGRIQVEHILPLSKSADDSYNNKTLSCINCNQNKNNQTPYEWLRTSNYEDFKQRIVNNKLFSDTKKDNFLLEADLDKYSIRFINRNLRDTAYATKELVNQINMFNCFLDENYDMKIKTLSTPGQITHKLRVNYDLDKNRDAGKFHHAVDASIVASIADTKLGEIIINSQNDAKYWIIDKQNRIDVSKTKNLISNLQHIELDNYINELKNIDSDDKVFISSQVNKSAQGQLSNANICKFIKVNDTLCKVSQIDNIYEAKVSDLEEFFNDDSRKVHLMIRDNNPKLYEKLKKIFIEYKDKGGNPFKSYCFDKYRSEDFDEIRKFNYLIHGIKSSEKANSPVVCKLRYYSNVGTPYLLEGEKYKNKKENTIIGLDSLKQYCTEIYYDVDNNKFAFLPVFSVSVDLNTGKINREDIYYKMMKEQYLNSLNVEYIVSVYNGDLMSFKKSDGSILFGRYSTFEKTNNKLKFVDNIYFTKSDLSFTMYDVDVLGNKKERLTYSIK